MHICVCICVGSTALVAVVRGTELTVANVGDSRGVLCDICLLYTSDAADE